MTDIKKYELAEKLYWEFDHVRKTSGEKRLAFKQALREYANMVNKHPVWFFSYGNEVGFVEHTTENDAKEALSAELHEYRINANIDGEWVGEVGTLCYGAIYSKVVESVDENESYDYKLS